MTLIKYLNSNMLDTIRKSFQGFINPQVPLWTKAIPVVAVLYFLSPIDIVPDFILGLGQLDDLAILILALKLFLTFATKYTAISSTPRGKSTHPFSDTPVIIEGEIID